MYSSNEYLSPTMDNLETASILSDNHSECLSSNLSSLSGLTGYEDELYDLKHLIKLPYSSPRPITKSNDNYQIEIFEARIEKLNSELQNALKSNEKHKNDMYNLERKTELAFHEKFEQLMRRNGQLEAQLEVMNDRVRKILTKNASNKSIAESELELNKKNFELTSKLNLLQNEVTHWKNEAQTGEIQNGEFKMQLEEAKIEIESRNKSVDGLKAKIVDLHVEMQFLKQNNVKISNSVVVTENELKSFQKSEQWYKQQLHQCRAQKSDTSEEVARLQSLLITKDGELQVKKADLSRLSHNNEELQLTMMREKTSLLKTIETLKTPSETPPSETPPIVDNYESTIETLQCELASIKRAVNDQQTSFETVSKQNVELITRNTTLQKLLNEKEIYLVNVEDGRKDLSMRLDVVSLRLGENEKLLMKVVNEKAELEAALNGANREKGEIEDAVTIIRENFSKFVGNYSKIKTQLRERQQKVLELQQGQDETMKVAKQLKEVTQTAINLEGEAMSYQKLAVQLGGELKDVQGRVLTITNELNTKDMWVRQLESEAKSHRQIVATLEQQLAVLNQSVPNERNKLQTELLHSHKMAASLGEELNIVRQTIATMTKERAQLESVNRQTLANLEQQLEVVCRLEEKLTSKSTAQKNLEEELQVLKATMATITNELQVKEELVRKLSENLVIERKDSLRNKSLQLENSELKDKIAKFLTNNFNGFTKSNKDEITQDFMCTLNWISNSLLAIQAREVPKLTCAVQNGSGEKIMEVSRLMTSIASARRIEYEQLNRIDSLNQQLKQKMSGIKSRLWDRLNGLEDRCELLQKHQKIDANAYLEEIKRMHQDKMAEDIKLLKIACKAKEMETKEKQKRYEVNNRTLLKKVKEHMRGRNSAEKRCTYLQELYNGVFDELNSYKLQETGRTGEIENLRNLCENYQNISVKMKQDLLKLEKELSVAEATKALVCMKCAEYESVKAHVEGLGAKLRRCEEELKLKEVIVRDLQVEIQHAVHANTTLQKESKYVVDITEKLSADLSERNADIVKLHSSLEKERKILEEAHANLLDEQSRHSACITRLENAQQSSLRTHDQNKLLSEEVEALTCKLEHLSNDIGKLKIQRNLSENTWNEKETHMRVFITDLQTEVQMLQNDLASTRSDKYFLQRLCTDLKYALQTCINQSKVLKKHIETLSSEKRDGGSLPDLPSPSKYDDGYINQLLKQSNSPTADKPLGDLQNCLNSLKKEMICLRRQVTERTGHV